MSITNNIGITLDHGALNAHLFDLDAHFEESAQKQSTLGDSLAHGCAHNVLRDFGDEAREKIDNIYRVFDKEDPRTPMTLRRARRLITKIDYALGDSVLWRGELMEPMEERISRDWAVCSWWVPLIAEREGLKVCRLNAFFKKRRPLVWDDYPIITVNAHVLARLFQRRQLTNRAGVLSVLRAVTNKVGMVRLLAESLGHKQWALPIGDDAAIIGSAVEAPLAASSKDRYVVNARTFLSPIGFKWNRYLTAQRKAVECIEHLDPDFCSFLSLSTTGQIFNPVGETVLSAVFAGAEFDWLKSTHD